MVKPPISGQEVPTLIIYSPSTGTFLLLLLSGTIGGIQSRRMKLCGMLFTMIQTLKELSSLSSATGTLIGKYMFMDLYPIMTALGARECYYHGPCGKIYLKDLEEPALSKLGALRTFLDIVQSMSRKGFQSMVSTAPGSSGTNRG